MRALLAAIADLSGSTVGRSRTAATARMFGKLQGIKSTATGGTCRKVRRVFWSPHAAAGGGGEGGKWKGCLGAYYLLHDPKTSLSHGPEKLSSTQARRRSESTRSHRTVSVPARSPGLTTSCFRCSKCHLSFSTTHIADHERLYIVVRRGPADVRPRKHVYCASAQSANRVDDQIIRADARPRLRIIQIWSRRSSGQCLSRARCHPALQLEDVRHPAGSGRRFQRAPLSHLASLPVRAPVEKLVA